MKEKEALGFYTCAKERKREGSEATSPIVFASVRKPMRAKGLEENLASQFVQSVYKLLKGMKLNACNEDLLQEKELAEVRSDFTRDYSVKLIASQVTVL